MIGSSQPASAALCLINSSIVVGTFGELAQRSLRAVLGDWESFLSGAGRFESATSDILVCQAYKECSENDQVGDSKVGSVAEAKTEKDPDWAYAFLYVLSMCLSGLDCPSMTAA